MPTIRSVPDLREAAEAAATFVAETVREAVASRGQAVIALCGGHDVPAALAELARREDDEPLPWPNVSILIADELAVAPTDPRSRYRAAHEALLSRVVPPAHVVRFWSEGDPPEVVADWYMTSVRQTLGLDETAWPDIDVALCSIEPDGTVGSLSSATPDGDPGDAFAVVATVREERRYTVVPDLLRRARRLVGIATGPGSADRLSVASALESRDGEAVWILDQVAAEGLDTL